MYYVDNQMNKKPLIPVIRRMLNIKSDNTARAEYRCSLLLLVFLILLKFYLYSDFLSPTFISLLSLVLLGALYDNAAFNCESDTFFYKA